MLRRFAGFGLLLLVAAPAGRSAAAPPENADPALRNWFESLKHPGSGVSCCSIADCRPVEYRLAAEGYEALLDAIRIRVPEHKILHGTANPTAHAILCRSPISGSILCFVPANET